LDNTHSGTDRLRPFSAARRHGAVKHQAEELERKLWGGFSRYALAELQGLARSTTAAPEELSAAAWSLARWHAFQAAPARALKALRQIAKPDDPTKLHLGMVLLEADCLVQLGDPSSARLLLSRFPKQHPKRSDICLAMANTFTLADQGDPASDKERLRWINYIYQENGLAPLEKIHSGSPLSIANIKAPSAAHLEDGSNHSLVTILMPAHNCAGTVRYALAGLQAQTYTNIEVIVVDDLSADETREIVSEISDEDPRIRLICLTDHAGAFVARNRGLMEARGAFVTAHDADDWSHPQKIEYQLAHLNRENITGSISNWARTSHDLYFRGGWRPKMQMLGTNHSSLLVSTASAQEMGGWDSVRIGADNEFLWRLRKRFGEKSLRKTLPMVPFSFSYLREESLTRRTATHARTAMHGIRADYRQMYSRWHERAAKSNDFRIQPEVASERRFPAPVPILPEGRNYPRFDAIFISDFAVSTEEIEDCLADIIRAISSGNRVGIFHWPLYDRDANRALNREIFRLIDNFAVTQISAYQKSAETNTLTLCNPLLAKHIVDGLPKFQFERFVVLNGELADIEEDLESLLQQGSSEWPRMG
jgi:glycosyltransferase involved in cell wall biosynthesis